MLSAASITYLSQRVLHVRESVSIDEGTDERFLLARIANRSRRVDLREPRHQAVIDIAMDKESAQRCAALACCAHGCEGDGADRQIEIGGRRDNGGVAAPELEDGAGETGGDAG